MKKTMKMFLTLTVVAFIVSGLLLASPLFVLAFDYSDPVIARADNCITFTDDEYNGTYISGFNPLSIPENALNLSTNYSGGLDVAVYLGAFSRQTGVNGGNGQVLKLDPSVLSGSNITTTFAANIYPGRYYTFSMRLKAASATYDLGSYSVSMYAQNSDTASTSGNSGNNRAEILADTSGWNFGWTWNGQESYYNGGWIEVKKTVYVPETCSGSGFSFTPEFVTVNVTANTPFYVDDVTMTQQSTNTFFASGTITSPYSSTISLQEGDMVFNFAANPMTISYPSSTFELYVKPYKQQEYTYNGSSGMIFNGIKSVFAMNSGRTENVTSFKPVVVFKMPDAVTSSSQIKVFYNYGNPGVVGGDNPSYYTVDVANHTVSVDFAAISANCTATIAEGFNLVIWGQGLTETDLEEPAQNVRAWWDNWARYSNYGAANSLPNAGWNRYKDAIQEQNADAATAVGGFRDEGIGPFASNDAYCADGIYNNKIFKADGIKTQAWIEGWGETRMYIMSIAKDTNGNYTINPKTNAPQVYASFWTWNSIGPNGSDASRLPNNQQEIAWSGLQDWVNRLPYQGRFVDASVNIPTPTYPGGASALGYLTGYDSTRPDKAKLYDACASKDLNGDYITYTEQNNCVGYTNQTGMIDVTYSNGTRYVLGDLSIGKDCSAPFWLEYARINVRSLLSEGADGFWIDNYIGWDNIRTNNILAKGFGDWSIWRFANEYLPAHPDVVTRAVAANATSLVNSGLDPQQNYTNYADFNIRTYMVERYKTLFSANPATYSDGKYTMADSNWNNVAWQSDPMYMAYLAFKSEQQTKASLDLYKVIKEEAAALGLDPESIAVTGNDFDFTSNAVMNVNGLPATYQQQFANLGNALLDIVHTENNGFITLPTNTKYPPRGRKGGDYAYMTEIGRTNKASVWSYSDTAHDNTGYGLVLGYEAFANNVTINAGDGISNVIGNDTSALAVNKVIGVLKSWFGYRERYAQVGVFYSGNSEFSSLSPNGYKSARGANYIAGISGYAGWAYALEEFNIPFTCVQESRLTEWMADSSHKLLILPYVKSISQSQVDQIKAWLDGNSSRRLIITGSTTYNELGSFDTRENQFKPHGTSLLNDLRNNSSYSAKIVYRSQDPAVEFYINQDLTTWSTSSNYYYWLYGRSLGTPTPANSVNGTLTDSKLSGVLTTIINIPSGSFGKTLSSGKLTSFQKVYTYVNYDSVNDRFFVDLVNFNINRSTGAITNASSGTINIALPASMSNLTASQLSVNIYYDDNGSGSVPVNVINRSDFTVSNGVLTINVPVFKTYYTIMINPA